MKYFVILLLLLLIPAAYIFIREKSVKEYQSPSLNLTGLSKPSEDGSNIKNRRGIIILDLADMSQSSVSDSVITPFMNSIIESSRVYNSAVNLSTDRFTALKSFMECLAPYKFNDGKEPYKTVKRIISEDIRNSSVFNEFTRSGYTAKCFTADSEIFKSTAKYFLLSELKTSNAEVLETMYKHLIHDKDTTFIYYADLTCGFRENENYLRDIDAMTGQFMRETDKKTGIEPLYLFISTQRTDKYAKTAAFFYQAGIEPFKESLNVSMTDIAKTLLNYSKVIPPNYFGGYDLEDGDENPPRDYFAGSNGDTLFLYNDDYIYKQMKHSAEYFYYDLKSRTDVTDKFIGINEKFEDIVPRYFGGDYIKYIILRNAGEKVRNFKFELKSVRRFEELANIKNYYIQTKKNSRYSKEISKDIEPGASDTIKIFYSSLYQDFDYSFSDKYALSYGSSGINAGILNKFEENSYYGMKYFYEDAELFRDYDVRIFNIRVNY